MPVSNAEFEHLLEVKIATSAALHAAHSATNEARCTARASQWPREGPPAHAQEQYRRRV